MFVKNLAFAGLFDQYAPVLGERHRTVLDLYYNQDLSLGEIAEILGISRQGVRDSIKKAEEELLLLEQGLHLAQRAQALRDCIAAAAAHADRDPLLLQALRRLEELIAPAQEG